MAAYQVWMCTLHPQPFDLAHHLPAFPKMLEIYIPQLDHHQLPCIQNIIGFSQFSVEEQHGLKKYLELVDKFWHSSIYFLKMVEKEKYEVTQYA